MEDVKIKIHGDECKSLSHEEWNNLIQSVNKIYDDIGVICEIKYFVVK